MSESISRQDAVDALKICDNNESGINCHKCPLRDERWDGAWENDETNCYTKLMRDSAKLLDLPSAQPERKKSGWIKKMRVTKTKEYVSYDPEWYCANCKTKYDPYVAKNVNFCYVCGADLREDECEKDEMD